MERLLAMVVTLFVGIYVARYLGPQRFGILSYAISFVGIFSVIATLGLDQIAVREFINEPVKRESILGTLFWLKLSGAFVVLGLILFALLFTNNDALTELLIFIIAASLIFQSFNVIDFYFQSQVLSKYIVFAQVFQLVLSSIAKISLVLLNGDLLWFGIVILCDGIIFSAGLLYFFHLRHKGIILRWKFDIIFAKRLLMESWPLALSGLAVTVYMKIDQIMIKEMLNTEAVGLYAAAVRLSEVWYFFPGIIMKSLFPAIISIKNTHDKVYRIRLQQLHDMLFSVALVIALLVFFFSQHIIVFLFGEQFLGASSLLAVHIWAGILVFPGNVRAHLIIIENKQIVALIFRSTGAILNIVLNYLLIPRFGAIGAAWATLASYILPICIISFFDPLIRLTLMMTLKSYLLPLRVLNYKRPLYGAMPNV
ncbi:MAG: flippase [Deltaproteobacteria bacterium]|nr:flippase [Deltaproteobacteria bacterium]